MWMKKKKKSWSWSATEGKLSQSTGDEGTRQDSEFGFPFLHTFHTSTFTVKKHPCSSLITPATHGCWLLPHHQLPPQLYSHHISQLPQPPSTTRYPHYNQKNFWTSPLASMATRVRPEQEPVRRPTRKVIYVGDKTRTIPNKISTENGPKAKTFTTNHVVTSKYTALNFMPKFLLEQFRKLANIWWVFFFLLVILFMS